MDEIHWADFSLPNCKPYRTQKKAVVKQVRKQMPQAMYRNQYGSNFFFFFFFFFIFFSISSFRSCLEILKLISSDSTLKPSATSSFSATFVLGLKSKNCSSCFDPVCKISMKSFLSFLLKSKKQKNNSWNHQQVRLLRLSLSSSLVGFASTLRKIPTMRRLTGIIIKLLIMPMPI